MSFPKKLTLTFVVALIWAMTAVAQDGANASGKVLIAKAAKPAKAAPMPQTKTAAKPAAMSKGYMTHRFEISFQGGGVVGGNLGQTELGSCTSQTTTGTDGCDINQALNHDDTS